jgi:hypothetical protein
MAASIKTYGTNRAISVSGESGVTVAAISVASAMASFLLCGFNFQLPEMNGLREAISRALLLLLRETNDGANAAEEETRAARERAENFMVSNVNGINNDNVYADPDRICYRHNALEKDLRRVTYYRFVLRQASLRRILLWVCRRKRNRTVLSTLLEIQNRGAYQSRPKIQNFRIHEMRSITALTVSCSTLLDFSRSSVSVRTSAICNLQNASRRFLEQTIEQTIHTLIIDVVALPCFLDIHIFF